ncbi:MAG: Gfo/Idh/MocA family oxidoreductase [Armatimonadetes bacterium]|nr:Gfo/Idh/MocA family oxidoreductase [Armatimonadota bacterium]
MSIKVGFVGAGGVANAHMNMLASIEDVHIAAITDSDRDRAESAAMLYLARPYADYREMLESEKLDALYVCVPPFAHGEQEILAASKGIHVFVEKPVAIDIDIARRTRDAIIKSGVVNCVGYHWRYQSNTSRVIRMFKNKTIGMVQGYWMGGMPGVNWWRQKELSGGQVVEQTTHIFDLIRYICGEVTEVYAAFSTRASQDIDDFTGYDVGSVALKLANGAVGSVSNTCILGVPYTVGVHFVAKDMVLELHGDLKVIEPGHTEIFIARENPMLAQNQAFIQAIQTGNISLIKSDYADAVKTLALTLACNESAMTGLPVAPKE